MEIFTKTGGDLLPNMGGGSGGGDERLSKDGGNFSPDMDNIDIDWED